jgi:hypothetical protein
MFTKLYLLVSKHPTLVQFKTKSHRNKFYGLFEVCPKWLPAQCWKIAYNRLAELLLRSRPLGNCPKWAFLCCPKNLYGLIALGRVSYGNLFVVGFLFFGLNCLPQKSLSNCTSNRVTFKDRPFGQKLGKNVRLPDSCKFNCYKKNCRQPGEGIHFAD